MHKKRGGVEVRFMEGNGLKNVKNTGKQEKRRMDWDLILGEIMKSR